MAMVQLHPTKTRRAGTETPFSASYFQGCRPGADYSRLTVRAKTGFWPAGRPCLRCGLGSTNDSSGVLRSERGGTVGAGHGACVVGWEHLSAKPAADEAEN